MLIAFNKAYGLRRRMLPPSFDKISDGIRSFSTDNKEARLALLRKIYEPFSKLEKDSPEYSELARSGKVWENHFQPNDSQRMGYKALQRVCKLLPTSTLFTVWRSVFNR